MTTPTTFFLDTSILDGQQYNYSSTAFTSFVAVAKSRGLRLLLPDPTNREVARHIRERSVQAIRALETARRKAPFLAKWKHYPTLSGSLLDNWEVRRIADAEWADFLKQFDVVRLGYDGVKISTIMDWYDSARAPFRESQKRKEFPDALAISILANYAIKNSVYIAVVASDDDFKRACSHYTWLLHFPNLPALTERLLADAEQINTIKALIDQSASMFGEAVTEVAAELSFYHASARYKEIEELDDLTFDLEDSSVVGLGIDECTVAFSGNLGYRALLCWKRTEEYYNDYYEEWKSAYVSDGTTISGTAKLQFQPGLVAIEVITRVELDDEEIEVTEEPW